MSDFTPVIHRHRGVEPFFVNAFLVETANSVVAVDSLIAMTDITALRDKIDRQIGKKLVAVLLTHGHPDHYTGAAELARGYGDVPIMATPGVRAQCETRDAEESGYLGSDQAFGADYPKHREFPNEMVTDGQVFTVDDVAFTCRDLGACESDNDLTWSVQVGDQTHTFSGDIVYSHTHAFFRDGHLSNWLQTLDRFAAETPTSTVFHPGHGDDFRVEMFHWQRAYHNAFRSILETMLNGRDTLDAQEQQELERHMFSFLPNQDLSFLTLWQFDDMVKALRADGMLR